MGRGISIEFNKNNKQTVKEINSNKLKLIHT